MGKSDENFIKRVIEIINEMKLPLINEEIYDKVKFNSKSAITTLTFKFKEDESIIRGFLGLAEFFHTVIIRDKNEFFIPTNSMLFVLEND